MEPETFHFADPLWFWGLMAIPIFWLLYRLFYHRHSTARKLEAFIDPHLLPHLLIQQSSTERSYWASLLLWSVIWGLGIVALAGPRWNYTDIEVFSADQNLVVLLDLSESMNTTDVKPSRMTRAHQEIEDLLTLSKEVNIGLVAFAADAHMINPLTDDREVIRHLLPSLDTDVVYVQGSRLTPALSMAKRMLDSEAGKNKRIVVISDGGFEDEASAIREAKALEAQGISIDTLGIGTLQGAPIPSAKGGFIKQNGTPVISKLDQQSLEAISHAADGFYQTANYTDQDGQSIVDKLALQADTEAAKEIKTRYWEERFYLAVFPMMIILLFWFRRSFVFPAVLLCLFLPPEPVQAEGIADYFKNRQQRGAQALEQEDYDTATQGFDDPYRQGVVQYKAGNYAEAEKHFGESSRSDVAEKAAYNLGNALARQQKLEEAMSTYEQLLKDYPDNEKARHNLDLVKKLIEQQKNQQEQNNSDQQNDKQQNQQDQNNSDQQNDQQQNQQEQNNSGQQNDQQQNQQDQNNSDQQNDQQQNQQEQNNSDQQNDNEQDQRNQNSQDEQENANAQESASSDEKNSQQAQQQDELSDKEQQSSPEDTQASQGSSQEEKQQQTSQLPTPDESNGVPSSSTQQGESAKRQKTQQDIDADQWLNRIQNDPKALLRNQFYLESHRNSTQERGRPW